MTVLEVRLGFEDCCSRYWHLRHLGEAFGCISQPFCCWLGLPARDSWTLSTIEWNRCSDVIPEPELITGAYWTRGLLFRLFLYPNPCLLCILILKYYKNAFKLNSFKIWNSINLSNHISYKKITFSSIKYSGRSL